MHPKIIVSYYDEDGEEYVLFKSEVTSVTETEFDARLSADIENFKWCLRGGYMMPMLLQLDGVAGKLKAAGLIGDSKE